MEIFDTCASIAKLIDNNEESAARNELIKLLDYHSKGQIQYSPLVNHLIRQTGLYPYMDTNTSSWQERFVYEAFKVDTGEEKELTLHREQSELLKRLLNGENIAVSAPTSFGKSFVIDAYISIMKPRNVFIIVPTIALTDETRRRLYKKFAKNYKIITTTDVELSDRNIFIFPQERAITYVDVIKEIDILIVDEFYKASSTFEKDRSPALIRAILKFGKIARQKYYLAPNISSIEDNPFTKDMTFLRLDFNTVYLEQHKLYEELGNDELAKNEMLLSILDKTSLKTLIYAGTYSNIDRVSNLILTRHKESKKDLLDDFSDWLGANYDYNWSLTSLVKRGTGVHNGRLHRSISQIQVRLFEEDDGLDNIISTSSIIEGVNTSAANVILWMNKNGRVKLNDFTYKNIIGRGGRMFKHFIGNIYILDAPPEEENTQLDLPFPDEILGDLDETIFERELSKEQISKIIEYRKEMIGIVGNETFEKLKAENVFQSSDFEIIKAIAIDMTKDPKSWNGLSFLNSSLVDTWDRLLYKVMGFNTGMWGGPRKPVVDFVKVIRKNWARSIPELLKELEKFDVNVDKFFKLERQVTYNLATIMNDVNILQKAILHYNNVNIAKFVSYCSHAFLPPVVYQLEEFGLPRMLSKQIHHSGIINFYDNELTLHDAIDLFNKMDQGQIIDTAELVGFDKYILNYFYEGITQS